jgi:hypothetical protein
MYNKDEAFNLADVSTRLRGPFNRFTRIRRGVRQPITDTDIFLYNKTNQMHKFPKFTPALNSTCFARSSVHHHELFTVNSAMVYVIQVCRQLSSRTRLSSILVLLESCLQTCMTYTIAKCTAINS